MVANKTSRFAFDWWIIQKRFVYLVIAIFLLCGMAAGAGLYVWGSYGITALLMLVEPMLAIRRRRRALRDALAEAPTEDKNS